MLSEDPDDRFRITVRRKHIFEDTLHKLHYDFDATKHLRVTFIGEPAIDDGGPTCEYLRLLLGSVASNNSLFCGDGDARFVRHNVLELKKRSYFHVGQIISLYLMHGGPAPTFLSEAIADYILYGLEKINTSINDVQDVDIKRKLQTVLFSGNSLHFHTY